MPAMTRKGGKRLFALLVLLLVAAALGYGIAGPWIAIRGIHAAIEDRDPGKLERYVDFPTLRANVRAKVAKRLLAAATAPSGRVVGDDLGRTMIGAISDKAVDAMVSPMGIALLLEGRALAHRVAGREPAPGGKDDAADPLLQAKTKFESASRFTATVDSADGRPVVFVFERKWLRWKLADIRLPD
jgi:hypothetical protein